ncbi:PREDICTED: scarecrow-like protein 33 isoform X2 [Camelina sativa]|uniref:Scarecrow-like protein 33 isoform X2 n=1 Tax=Camelina sativa TaxID=90675 RepID=A0ABM0Z529_CAMSA|nr:PREDICTED: scarecrow-like protein 33 isoform X2 [Camelina sativa]
MGSYSAGFPGSLDWFDFPALGNGLYLNDQPLLDTGSVPPLPPEPPSYSQQNLASADAEFSDSVLKYISQVLMEEDIEDKPCMFHDALSLQAAEKSLYEALGEKYPEDDASHPMSITTTRPAHLTPIPNNFVFQSTSMRSSPSPQSVVGGGNAVFVSSFSNDLVSNMFNDKEMELQFKKGMEEASKFLPKSSQLVIDIPALGSKGKDNSVPYRMTGKKSQLREDEDSDEERSKKQAAVYVDESELTEMFNKVLIFGEPMEPPVCILQESFQKEPEKASSVSKSHKGEKPAANDKETPDLRTMLVSCAQAVSINDRRTADDLLTRIRQHSSSYGDGTERLAHYFANSLEARLAGIGTQVYTALSSKKTSVSDMLQAYQTYISVCPFKKIAIIFANHSIMRLASTANAKTIHIIDFGISYGFQWPSLIHRLAWRRGSSCKLRITGIELPQRGFRPAEGVIETGHRLAKYCQKFNIPFEYNAIAQKWENIKLEDLKLKEGEFVAVNSLFRFRNLLDETVAVHSPRDAVLKLIRKIKPDVFMPAILSGSYNAPFFVTRFREVLFHYSSLFDMCDTTLTRDDPMRVMFEKEFYGREIMNVVACEGTERVERPESYKQWQARAMRAGFRQIPLDKDLVQKLKLLVENGYKTKEFDVDQDCNWLLQGWKGRIVYASSVWVPL